MEGDAHLPRRACAIRISTHALTLRATLPPGAIAGAYLEFLPTPSHGGRHLAWSILLVYRSISTHALTWRATKVAISPQQVLEISTHALTWRATIAQLKDQIEQSISTHALTWRATNAGQCGYHACGFLPTPSHGGRPSLMSTSFCVL